MKMASRCGVGAAFLFVFSSLSDVSFAGSAEMEDQLEEERQRQLLLEQAREVVEVGRKARIIAEAGVAYFDMDVVNGFGAAIDDVNSIFVRQPDDGFDLEKLGVEVGLTFLAPIRGGKKLLIGQLEGAWVDDEGGFDLVLGPDEYLDTLPITGALSPGEIATGPVGAFPGAEVSVSEDGDFYRIGGFLGFGKEKCDGDDEGEDDCMLGLGLYGSFSELDFKARFDAFSPSYSVTTSVPTLVFDPFSEGFITVFVDVTTNFAAQTTFLQKIENIQTWSLGPMLIGSYGFALSERVKLRLGGRLAALYADGDLEASQFGSNLGSGLHVSDSDNGFAYLAEVRAGLEIKTTEWLTLSLFGSAEGRNDYFKAINPQSGPGVDSDDASSYNLGPARLDQDFQFIAAVGGGVTISF